MKNTITFLAKVKMALAATPKLSRSDLKYGKVKNAEQAWRLYFRHLLTSLRQLSAQDIKADVIPLPLNKEQTLLLSDIFDFLNQTVIDLSYAVLDYVDLMKKFNDNEVFNMILAEFHAELAFQFTNLRQKTKIYKRKIEELSLSHDLKYKKYEKYLNEILKLTADSFVTEYLLKSKMPLDGFDTEFLD